MGAIPATDAPEHRLALAVLGGDMITGWTGLGTVAGVDEYHGYPGGGGFVGESPGESAPTGLVNYPVQPGLGSGAVGEERSGRIRVGFRVGAAHHILGHQVLEHDQIVVPDQGGGGLFDPVVPAVGDPGVCPADLGLGLGSAARSWLLAGEALVEAAEFDLKFRAGWDAQHLAVRCGDRGGYASVDPNRCTRADAFE